MIEWWSSITNRKPRTPSVSPRKTPRPPARGKNQNFPKLIPLIIRKVLILTKRSPKLILVIAQTISISLTKNHISSPVTTSFISYCNQTSSAKLNTPTRWATKVSSHPAQHSLILTKFQTILETTWILKALKMTKPWITSLLKEFQALKSIKKTKSG